jgi:hypothetical protein
VGASIVSGVDASPALEPAEHALDPVALAVEGPVVVDLSLMSFDHDVLNR